MRFAPFALERFFARYEFSVRYTLGSSDCETCRVADLLALEPGAEARLLALPLGYTEATGSAALREALSEAFYPTTSRDGILVCSGAEEALFLYFHAVLSPGDHVVVQTPCYGSLTEVPRALGAEVAPWRGAPADGFRPSLAALDALLRPSTRLVVVNTPHNPTGARLSRAELDDLVAMLAPRGIRLLCDEVYRELEADPGHRLPPACEVYERAASVGVLSKAHGLPGLRIGWLATRDAQALSSASVAKDYTTICNAGPSELLAEVAVRHHERLSARSRGLLAAHRPLLAGFLARHADLLRGAPPEAGPLTLLALSQGDDAAFCARVAEEAGVLLVPGSTFGEPGYVRMGLGRASFPEALAAFEEYLAAGAAPAGTAAS